MTEKRFIPVFDKYGYHIIGAKDNGVIICLEEVFDKLNELSEKNEKLKQQLRTKHIVNEQYEELQRLKEENKELKQQVEDLYENDKSLRKRFIIKRNGFCKYYVSDKLNQYSMPITDSISCEVIAYALNELYEENEELKQKIEALKMEIAELRESEKDNYNVTDGLW